MLRLRDWRDGVERNIPGETETSPTAGELIQIITLKSGTSKDRNIFSKHYMINLTIQLHLIAVCLVLFKEIKMILKNYLKNNLFKVSFHI